MRCKSHYRQVYHLWNSNDDIYVKYYVIKWYTCNCNIHMTHLTIPSKTLRQLQNIIKTWLSCLNNLVFDCSILQAYSVFTVNIWYVLNIILLQRYNEFVVLFFDKLCVIPYKLVPDRPKIIVSDFQYITLKLSTQVVQIIHNTTKIRMKKHMSAYVYA